MLYVKDIESSASPADNEVSAEHFPTPIEEAKCIVSLALPMPSTKPDKLFQEPLAYKCFVSLMPGVEKEASLLPRLMMPAVAEKLIF